MRKIPKKKILLAALATLAVLCVTGFLYVAFTDIPVPRQNVVKEIPHDRFTNSP